MRNLRNFRPIRDILHISDPVLGGLLDAAERLNRLDRMLQARVNPDQRGRFRVAAIRGEALILEVDSPSWASRLRYQSASIVRIARQYEPRLRSLRIRIAPVASPPPPKDSLSPLSPAVADNLKATAEGISDPALRTSLLRLARRCR